MQRWDGRIALLGFGIHCNKRHGFRPPQDLRALGRAEFIPPELLGGRYDCRSDAYQIGMTLAALAMGTDFPVIEHLSDSTVEGYATEFEPNVDASCGADAAEFDLENIIRAGAAKNPKDRLNMAALIENLSRLNEMHKPKRRLLKIDFPSLVKTAFEVLIKDRGFARLVAEKYAFLHVPDGTFRQGKAVKDFTDYDSKDSQAQPEVGQSDWIVGREDAVEGIYPHLLPMHRVTEPLHVALRESISRQHACIRRFGDYFGIKDLNSANGTQVHVLVQGGDQELPEGFMPLGKMALLSYGDAVYRWIHPDHARNIILENIDPTSETDKRVTTSSRRITKARKIED
jgi:hypothetical protein